MKVSTEKGYIILSFLPIGQDLCFNYHFKVGTKAKDLYKMIEQTTKLRYGVAEDFVAEFDCGGSRNKFYLSQGDYIDLKRFILKYEHNYDAMVEESIPPRRIINAIMELVTVD